MNTHHRLNYVEFQARDLEVIKIFYSSVFGWTFEDYGPTYVAFNDGTMDGGFELGTEISQGTPLVILYSDHLEDSQKEVKRHGGSITVPIFSFPGGRRFHFADPSGNILAVWGK